MAGSASAASASAAMPGAKGFASARQIFATAEDGELAYRLQGEEWVDTKEGNQFRSTTVRKDVKVARREQMTEEELLIFHRQQLTEVADADSQLARRMSAVDGVQLEAARRESAKQAADDAAVAAFVSREHERDMAEARHERELIHQRDEEMARQLFEQENTAERERRASELVRDQQIAERLQREQQSATVHPNSIADLAATARIVGVSVAEQEAELRRLDDLRRTAARDAELARRLGGLTVAADKNSPRGHLMDPTSSQAWEPVDDDSGEEV